MIVQIYNDPQQSHKTGRFLVLLYMINLYENGTRAERIGTLPVGDSISSADTVAAVLTSCCGQIMTHSNKQSQKVVNLDSALPLGNEGTESRSASIVSSIIWCIVSSQGR